MRQLFLRGGEKARQQVAKLRARRGGLGREFVRSFLRTGQALGRDIVGRAPNFALRFRMLRGEERKAKINDLRRAPVSKEDVTKLDVAMNQTRSERRLQILCHLQTDIERLQFRIRFSSSIQSSRLPPSTNSTTT